MPGKWSDNPAVKKWRAGYSKAPARRPSRYAINQSAPTQQTDPPVWFRGNKYDLYTFASLTGVDVDSMRAMLVGVNWVVFQLPDSVLATAAEAAKYYPEIERAVNRAAVMDKGAKDQIKLNNSRFRRRDGFANYTPDSEY